MPDSQPACLFTEGQITLPDGCQDRTVNVFILPGTHAPACNISRDALNDGENLPAYIDRQLVLIARHLKDWKQTARGPAVLGDNLVQGECVHASYLRDGRRVFQQQAVFNTNDRHVLVFTMTSGTALTAPDNTLFLSLLRSFRFNA
ncbi:DcrB-related protein [Erwinia sp. V71]|uniref:DcrB-related protein n=1 Tax=Erwinia sp. V71 TaxID=3369424 RepID=UPI003F5ED4A1